jgi:hypothetical protein
MVELEALTSDKPKYEVRKVEDGSVVDDAVVIRLKDPFAATALYTYCNTIMSFVELLEEHADNFKEDDHQRLLDIADYFHGQAMESERIKGKKLPD